MVISYKLIRGTKKIFFFLTFLFVIKTLSFGNFNKFDSDSIPDSLRINADAIIREYSTILEVEAINSARKKVHFAITILNKSGEYLGVFNETYHKFLKVENYSGGVYDSKGRLVRELKKSDFKDLSAISGYTLFDDTRRKYLSPVTNFYPYTIEYDYEIVYEGLFYYPTWYPISSYNLACENATMQMVMPENTNFRYYVNHLDDNIITENQNNKTVSSWHVSNILAVVDEDYSLPLSQIVPSIKFAPNNFEIDGYYGNQQTWQNFGLWVKSLNEGKQNLEAETIEEIKHEIGKQPDTLELIKDVYSYVQSRTRYVNLKLGIGGYQPIDAETVHNVGYGDCKALTNYTQSILNIYGIRSHYTLVQAGKDAPDIEVNFPTAQFNHAFLSVPYKKDTIWLECTSQTNPFGYIGGFTDNRDVLLITNNGGEIVQSPDYNSHNLIKRVANVKLDENGNAKAEISFLYKGIEYSDVDNIFELPEPEQKKWVYNKLPFPSFTINDLEIYNTTEDSVQAFITMHIDLQKYASLSNKRIFLPLLSFKNNDIPLLSGSSVRQNDIYIKDGKTIVDSVVLSYPTGYKIEYLPKSGITENQFGKVITKTNNIEGQNKILVYSCIKLKSGLYDKSYFEELADLTQIVNKNNNSKAVLVKIKKSE